MWRNAIWLLPVGVVVVLLLLPKADHGFVIPEHFPAFPPAADDLEQAPPREGLELATFGSGCFWCTEAVFSQLNGVSKVVSGYSGGSVPNPTYQQVCGGNTGHAEVVQVTFDPVVITYPELLEVFWRSHDPTTPNRQGHDSGTQYRSAILYHNDRQRRQAERYKGAIDLAGVYPAPIVTEIMVFSTFYPAEGHHQGFFASNARQPYCQAVIGPKVEKLRRVFREKVKPK